MNFIRLTCVLALVAAVSAYVLAMTYSHTKEPIRQQEIRAVDDAVRNVFFTRFSHAEAVTVEQTALGPVEYFKVFMEDDTTLPSFLAVRGSGTGYNTAVPIELLVGFTNPAAGNVTLPDGSTHEGEMVCVGWNVVRSEETPGLGENIKDRKAPYTLVELLTGRAPETPDPDARTPFQSQFQGKVAGSMKSGDTIEIITGATYTTNGVISAVQNAQDRLTAALAPPPDTDAKAEAMASAP